MSGRVVKRKADSEISQKTRERRSLAEAVERHGVDVMPCTYCFKSNKLSTALGRLSRLRKQKRFLKDRGSELIRRGLQSLDELEAQDREVAEAEARVEQDLVSWGAGEVFDWSSLGVGSDFAELGPLSPSRGTAEGPAGNVGGS
ncbi:hypothetical protein CH063_14938 [Colletotrichum higginsianum]|uniref:Uncharacterized protein n=1 Tax=Colletotrichum higginsianum (strain IMI 349063) TaxID=759273 RepID=H1W0Q3_COLHI|nr:hypothetical protein CH063_14938 [Colletotrichum higginsianum]